MNTILWVNGSKVDLFETVGINLRDSIKKAKDPGTITTSYAQQFTVPASNNNNLIFKHFDDPGIVGGFDARRKHPATIQVGGADFQSGYVKLLGADVKNGRTHKYRLQFTGEISSLKEKLGEDLIQDLDYLSRYNHDFDITTVRGGFETSLEYNGSTMVISTGTTGEIVYPLISHTRGFQYTTTDGFYDITEPETPTSNDRLDYTDLKPALRIDTILEGMEDKYGITFAGNFIDEKPFNQIYLWCHKAKGGLVTDDPTTNLNQWLGDIEDLTLDSFTNDPSESYPDIEVYDQDVGEQNDWDKYQNINCVEQPVDVGNEFHIIAYDFRPQNNNTGQRTRYEGNLRIIPSGSFTADYNVEMFHRAGTGQITYFIQESNLNGASGDLPFNINPFELSKYNIIFRVTSDTLDAFDIELDIDGYRDSRCTDELVRRWTYSKSVIAAEVITKARIPFNLPKIKCIDFLRGLFNLFNLVAYSRPKDLVSGTQEIVLETLDLYYDNGKIIDVTPFVEASQRSVERVAPYNRIGFEFQEPSTFLAIKGNELTGREFGNLEWNASDFGEDAGDFLFDGEDYSIEVPFEKMQFERMLNQQTGALTQIQWGWFVNDFSENTAEPELGEPLLFFPVNRDITVQPIEWEDGTSSTVMNAPSNVNTEQDQTLHFGAEIDEFTLLSNEESLYDNYYLRYISSIFNQDARQIKVTMYLPPNVIFNYRLQDKFYIKGTLYNIDNLVIDLEDGKTEATLNKLTGLTETYDIIGSGNCYAVQGYVEESYWCNPFTELTPLKI